MIDDEFIRSVDWLEPLLPASIPDQLLSKADRLLFAAGQLDGALAPETAKRLGSLLQITNSFYSNLIEGQYTEPAALEASRPRQAPKLPDDQLRALANQHVVVQVTLDRWTKSSKSFSWAESLTPDFLCMVHKHLFQGPSIGSTLLSDGKVMIPGQLRGDAAYEVQIGQHLAPHSSIVLQMLRRLQQVYGRIGDPRYRLLAAFAYHHRLAWVHPFADGNGRTVRLMTHVHLKLLGLEPSLWSISRGLARRRKEYYDRLSNADAPRRGDLDGRGKLSQAALVEFIDFMLDICLDQVEYMKSAIAIGELRERLELLVGLSPKMRSVGVRVETAKAIHALFVMGSMPRSDFKDLTGLGDRLAISELTKLIKLGVVESPTPKSREIYPGLPVWFAQDLFPDLHRRFN